MHGPDDAAQPVVLLHGNGTMSDDFELSGLVDEAAQRHRVWVFDRPGFGYSTRPADRPWRAHEQAHLLHAAVQQLGVHRPVVLGHSSGAQAAPARGMLHPQDVAALVLAPGYYTPSLRLDVAREERAGAAGHRRADAAHGLAAARTTAVAAVGAAPVFTGAHHASL